MSPHHFTVDIASGHPAFSGHFPGHPILPGVVLLAEVLAGAERCLGLALEQVQIKVAKFHAPVLPGSTLSVELAHHSAITFTVSCNGTRVASGIITMNDSIAARRPAATTPPGAEEAR